MANAGSSYFAIQQTSYDRRQRHAKVYTCVRQPSTSHPVRGHDGAAIASDGAANGGHSTRGGLLVYMYVFMYVCMYGTVGTRARVGEMRATQVAPWLQ